MKFARHSIGDLENIGPTIARNLAHIGIHTRSDLENATSVGAYIGLCNSFPNKTWPICYYLYSLEGALRDQHWNELPSELKSALLRQARERLNHAEALVV